MIIDSDTAPASGVPTLRSAASRGDRISCGRHGPRNALHVDGILIAEDITDGPQRRTPQRPGGAAGDIRPRIPRADKD